MNILDGILIVLLLIFIWKGFRTGLIGAIGNFFGILAGIWAGTHYMEQAGTWIMSAIDIGNVSLANILGFVGIFLAINIVVGIVVMIINRVFHIIPFIDLMNKLLGAFVGFIGGALAVSALVYLLSVLPISNTISDALISSQLAHIAAEVAIIVKPFIPEAINELKSIL